jgi:hypothetical protein
VDFGFLKTLFIAIPVLAFGIWQLISVNREIAADRERDEAARRTSADTGHSEGQQ